MKNISAVWAPGRAARTRRAGVRRSARVPRPPPRPLPRPRPRPRTGRATRWRGGAGRADTPPDTAPPPAPGTSNQRRTSTSRTVHQAQATVRYYTDITHAGVGIFLSSKNDTKKEPFLHFLNFFWKIHVCMQSVNHILGLFLMFWIHRIVGLSGNIYPPECYCHVRASWPWRGWWGCHTGHDTHHTSSPLQLHCYWALLCGKITHFVTAAATAPLLLTHVPCCRHSEEPCSVHGVQQVRRWGQRARLPR